MRCSRSRAPCGSAPRNISTIRHWFATSSRTGAKRRASSRGRPCARYAERWGWHTHERAGAAHYPGARAQRQGARRALHRAAGGPVYPARCARGLLRDLRGTARSAALPHPQGEPRHPRHPHGTAHRAVHGVRRGDAHEESRTGRRVPGHGGDVDGNQIAHAPSSPDDAGRGRRGPARRTGPAPARVREDEARRAEARRAAAAPAGLFPRGGLDRADSRAAPVAREELSVREHMSLIVRRLRDGGFAEFGELFDPGRGAPVLIVNYLAVLELVRESLIEVTQSESFAPIYVKLAHAQSE